jgi:2-octaprenyl-6-methoxyphenol hydroxylase
MTDTIEGYHQSGVVWCGPKDTSWETLPTDDLEKRLMEIFPFYGKVTLKSSRWTFPVTALTVDKITASRTVLVGDAAHALHPIAGQGVNLGWRDVADIAKLLANAKNLGADLGAEQLLKQYERRRKLDHKGLYFFTNGLTRLYDTDNSLVSFMRQTSIAVVGKIPPLKKFFMKKAMGV